MARRAGRRRPNDLVGFVRRGSAEAGPRLSLVNLASSREELRNESCYRVPRERGRRWGIAEPTSGPWWVADNGTDKSTLYNADGTKRSLVVSIVNGAPTGTVFNGGSGFVVSLGAKSGPAAFIFASESGTISGWNPNVDPTNSVVAVTTAGAVYKGLALASRNIENSGTVEPPSTPKVGQRGVCRRPT
jgi:hypothetical protein